MEQFYLRWFGLSIEGALKELRERETYVSPECRRSCLTMALFHVRHALRSANDLNDSAKVALCHRVIEWMAADLGSEPA